MAASVTTVTGPVTFGDGTVITKGKLLFELTSWDAETGESFYVSGPFAVDVSETGNFSIDLFTNSMGKDGNTTYKVSASYLSGIQKLRTEELGFLFLDQPGIFKLADLPMAPSWTPNTPEVLAQTMAYAASAETASTLAQAAAAGAETSETNAGSHAAAVALSADNAATSAGQAAASSQSAATSATDADAAANSAATSATNAGTSASDAATSASEAEGYKNQMSNLSVTSEEVDPATPSEVVYTQLTNTLHLKLSKGLAGQRGEFWFSAATAPSGVTGEVGDRYLNTATGDHYEKTGATTWTLQGNLKGDQGVRGDNFTVDATGLLSERSTHDGQAAGFSFLATDTGDIYIRETATSGTWSSPIPFRGPQGNKGDKGDDGLDGAKWLTGTAVPTGATGDTGDFYLNTTTSDVYEKTATTVWTLRSNIKGLKGDKGDKPTHEWSGTQLRLQNPDGSFGGYVDLRGPQGPVAPRDSSDYGVYYGSNAGKNIDTMLAGEDGLVSVTGNAGTMPPTTAGVTFWWIKTQKTYGGSAAIQTAEPYASNGSTPVAVRYWRARGNDGLLTAWKRTYLHGDDLSTTTAVKALMTFSDGADAHFQPGSVARFLAATGPGYGQVQNASSTGGLSLQAYGDGPAAEAFIDLQHDTLSGKAQTRIGRATNTTGGYAVYIHPHDGTNVADWAATTGGDTTQRGDLDAGTALLKTPTLLRKRYVNVLDYVPTSDLADCHAGIAAALADGVGGREIVFGSPLGGSARRYALTSRDNGGFVLPSQAHVIMEPGAWIDASDWDVSGTPTAKTLFSASGQYDYFSTAIVGYASSLKRHYIEVPDASLWKNGDVGFIYSSNVFTSKEGGNAGRNAEYFVVADRVLTGNRLYLTGALQGTYTTGVGCRKQVLKGQLIFENPQLLGPSAFANNAQGDMGIAAYYLDEARIIGGSIKNFDKGAVWLYAPRRFKVDGVEASIAPFQTDSPTRYAIAVADTTESGIIENCVVRGGREAISLTNSGSSGLMGGPTRDVTIRGNDISGAQRSGINTHDNHQNLVIDGNFIHDCESFVNLRVRDVRLTNNRGHKAGLYLGSIAAAVHLENGAGNFVANNNHWSDCSRGWWISNNTTHEIAPGDWHVSDDKITGDLTHHAVWIEFDGSTDVPDDAMLGSISFEDVDWKLTGTGSTCRAVYGRGQWDDFRLTGRIRGGKPTDQNNVVYTREANGGTKGVNRAHIDISYDTAGFLTSRIDAATGKIFIREIGLDGLADNELGRTLLTNAYWNIGSLAPQGTSFFDVAVASAAIGDFVQVSTDDTTLAGIWIWAEIITAGSVRIRAFNASAGTINPGGGQFYLNVTKRTI